MKERPVIFNGEMVRAILDGRKTQTRRLVPEWQRPKHYPENDDDPHYNCMAWLIISPVRKADCRRIGRIGQTKLKWISAN